MAAVKEAFEGHAIVEIMGHQTFAGYVSEQVVGGGAMVRVDVPAVGDEPAFTKLFGVASIYCITPVSEDVAFLAAKRTHSAPVSVYMPELHPRDDAPKRLEAYGIDDYD